MNFRKILKNIISSILYVISIGLLVAGAMYLQVCLSRTYNVNTWLLPSVLLIALPVIVGTIRKFIRKLAAKMVSQHRYDYLLTLKSAAEGMTLVTDVKRLFSLIVHILSRQMRVNGSAIYVFDSEKDRFIRAASRGFDSVELPVSIDKNFPLIRWLIERKKAYTYDNLMDWIQKEKLFLHRKKNSGNWTQIRNFMTSVDGYLCIPSFLRNDMVGFLIMGKKHSGEKYSKEDISLLLTLANNAAIAIENAKMYGELNNRIGRLKLLYQKEHSLVLDTASAFSFAIDTKDGYTHAHTLKVAERALSISRNLEELMPAYSFDKKFYSTLKVAALLHDVGKIGISDRILCKKGRLTEAEEAQLKRHTIISEKILFPMKEIEEVFEIIRHHHENYDGNGYPDGLRAEEIPLISRIIAVANVYDAMISDRPYRKGLHKNRVIDEIRKEAGKKFDPLVVEAFLKTCLIPNS
ncbi:MAG: HD domain-containing phosphohydrolase [Candidatus Omnitrophota bacterium]